MTSITVALIAFLAVVTLVIVGGVALAVWWFKVMHGGVDGFNIEEDCFPLIDNDDATDEKNKI